MASSSDSKYKQFLNWVNSRGIVRIILDEKNKEKLNWSECISKLVDGLNEQGFMNRLCEGKSKNEKEKIIVDLKEGVEEEVESGSHGGMLTSIANEFDEQSLQMRDLVRQRYLRFPLFEFMLLVCEVAFGYYFFHICQLLFDGSLPVADTLLGIHIESSVWLIGMIITQIIILLGFTTFVGLPALVITKEITKEYFGKKPLDKTTEVSREPNKFVEKTILFRFLGFLALLLSLIFLLDVFPLIENWRGQEFQLLYFSGLPIGLIYLWVRHDSSNLEELVKYHWPEKGGDYYELREESRQKAADHLTNIISNITKEFENIYANKELDPLATTVPEYKVERPWRSLSEQYGKLVETKDLVQLLDYIDTLDRASIGLAGERGAGKTSLMYALREKLSPKNRFSREFLTVWISAPTLVKEQEFLLSVLAKLASRFGAELTENELWPDNMPEDDFKIEKKRLWLLWGRLGFMMAMIFLLSYNWTSQTLSVSQFLTWQNIGISLGGLIFLELIIRTRKNFFLPFPKHHPKDKALLMATQTLLQDLWFDQKETQSTTSSLSPAGAGLGFQLGYSEEKTKRPFTLPHLVQKWDGFVEHVATSRGGFGKLIIFIDEVDKIKDSSEIGQFMRILKALFKPQKLFFVVSISEDAYGQFQSRGIRGTQRNEFDSSFDKMVFVKRMNYLDTYNLLEMRVIGDPIPHPFVQMIWIISKGNPRESLRLAREILQKSEAPDEGGQDPKSLQTHTIKLSREFFLHPLCDNFYAYSRQSISTHLDCSELLSAINEIQTLARHDAQVFFRCYSTIESVIESAGRIGNAGNSVNFEGIRNTLRNLKASLFYAQTLLELYTDENRNHHRFKEFKKTESILIEVQEHLEEGFSEQAWLKLNHFRQLMGLEVIQYNGSHFVSSSQVVGI